MNNSFSVLQPAEIKRGTIVDVYKRQRLIKRVDESGNECEFPYEIIVYMD